MWAARAEQGYVFGDLTKSALETLKGVPMLLESNDPRVRDRLLPETCEDAEDERQWRDHAVPELERLFQSRAQVVRRDLSTIRQIPESGLSVLLIPDEHVNAWLAALNAARLALFVLNDMTAEHLEEEGFLSGTPKQQEAALRISLLAEIQAVMLGEYEVEGDDESDDDPSD